MSVRGVQHERALAGAFRGYLLRQVQRQTDGWRAVVPSQASTVCNPDDGRTLHILVGVNFFQPAGSARSLQPGIFGSAREGLPAVVLGAGMTSELKLQVAVIYARLASMPCGRDGDAFAEQVLRCKSVAEARGLHVAAVFRDHGSGNVRRRQGLDDMISYIMTNQSRRPVVIIDDLTRLSRDVDLWFQLDRQIRSAGASIVSASMKPMELET